MGCLGERIVWCHRQLRGGKVTDKARSTWKQPIMIEQFMEHFDAVLVPLLFMESFWLDKPSRSSCPTT